MSISNQHLFQTIKPILRLASKIGMYALVGLLLIGATSCSAGKLLPDDGSTQAPDFKLVDIAGNFHELSDARGKKVLLYFLAPWCGMCKASVSNLERLKSEVDPKEVAIYAVALEWESPQDVRNLAETKNITVPILLGGPAIAEDYRIDSFPTYYVIDKNGRIVNHATGFSSAMGLKWRLG